MDTIKVHEIDWLQSLQNSERAGSFRNPLVDIPSAFNVGWDTGQGVVVVRVAPPDIAKAMLKQRQDFIAEHRKDEDTYTLVNGETEEDTYKVTGKEIAEYAQKLWSDKDGKLITPKYQGIPCNRRGYAMPASQLGYAHLNNGKTFGIPIEVRDISTSEDMFIIRMRENSNTGRSEYTLADLVGCAVMGVGFGHTETQIRTELNLGRGKSQTVHSLAMLCNKHKGINLLERLQTAKPVDEKGKSVVRYEKNGWINISGFTGNANRTLLGKAGKTTKGAASIDTIAMKAMGIRSKAKAVGQVATTEQVEKFIQLTIAGKVNNDKIMSKDTIATFRDQSNGIARDFLSAILDNSTEKMALVLDKLEAVK